MITKLDLMDEGTDAREILENKLLPLRRGEGPDAPFPSGGNEAAVRGEPQAEKRKQRDGGGMLEGCYTKARQGE